VLEDLFEERIFVEAAIRYNQYSFATEDIDALTIS